MKNINFAESGLSFTIDPSIYSLNILHKCFYWYGDRFGISFDNQADGKISVSLISKKDTVPFDQEEIIMKIKQDLIDFKLRDIVTQETKVIRELLLAKAFAHYEEEEPTSDISDPVGFHPESFVHYE